MGDWLGVGKVRLIKKREKLSYCDELALRDYSFSIEELESWLRFMGSGKNIGKADPKRIPIVKKAIEKLKEKRRKLCPSV